MLHDHSANAALRRDRGPRDTNRTAGVCLPRVQESDDEGRCAKNSVRECRVSVSSASLTGRAKTSLASPGHTEFLLPVDKFHDDRVTELRGTYLNQPLVRSAGFIATYVHGVE